MAGSARWADILDNAATPLVVLSYAEGTAVVRDAATLAWTTPRVATIVRAARALVPGGRIAGIGWLTAPDALV
jgi:hypothetical protein